MRSVMTWNYLVTFNETDQSRSVLYEEHSRNGESEFILSRQDTPDDYLKLVKGQGIVEYTLDGVLWKAVR